MPTSQVTPSLQLQPFTQTSNVDQAVVAPSTQPSPKAPELHSVDEPTLRTVHVSANPLGRTLFEGAAPLGPEAVVVTSSYQHSVRHALAGSDTDLARMKSFFALIVGQANVKVWKDPGQGALNAIFHKCRQRPSCLYVNGHASSSKYFPNDSTLEEDWFADSSGAPFSEIRLALIDTPDPMKLIVVADMCGCYNFLSEPLKSVEDGRKWSWKETKEYQMDGSGSWDESKEILHFAATEESGEAHEWESIGGIFTREFSNVHPDTSLGARLDTMEAYILPFLDKYARGKVQKPQIYSSHKFDFDQVGVLKAILSFK
ncbi:ICE-like protease (caspase) p20 domain protein [Ceratobasidium sp. AG-Ba]|nr:ICE-like protease (caspase) p20 domain protein [Ceratobasidium sp. AG-Ba]